MDDRDKIIADLQAEARVAFDREMRLLSIAQAYGWTAEKGSLIDWLTQRLGVAIQAEAPWYVPQPMHERKWGWTPNKAKDDAIRSVVRVQVPDNLRGIVSDLIAELQTPDEAAAVVAAHATVLAARSNR